KALELVLQKSLVRNIESNEQELFFYPDGSLQLQKENQIGISTKMGLGWLQLSEDKSYIVDEAGEELLVVPTQELSIYTTLSWKHFVIESPARKFLNLVLDLKTGAELMNAKTFRKIEPSLDESVFSWNLLWENLHELSGVRCDAMDKSKKLCTFWKCLQGKLPVLAE
ncbi:26149_t:CDS:2, partial [Gigaspora rosea]